MNPEELPGLDEMFPELVGVKPPLHRRIYYWVIVWWANLKGKVSDVGPKVEGI